MEREPRTQATEETAQQTVPASREPKPARGRRGKKRRWPVLLLDTALILIALTMIGVLFVNKYMNNSAFVETHYVIQSDKISSQVRTVVIADLHLKEFGESNSTLLERVEALRPDFISIVGDMFLYGSNVYEPVYTLCEKLVEIAPVYYAMGNHELSEILNNDAPIKARLKETGVTLLHNSVAEVEINGNKLVLGGLSQKQGGIEKYAPNFMEDFLSRDGFRLLLTHFPSNFIHCLEDEDIDLALSGHEHGGIIRLPILHGLYSADQGLLPELAEGKHYVGNTTLIISRGLGDSSIVPRVNNEPELVIVDLCDSRLRFNY